ncbi:MAG: CIA30 family protein [Gammaproteobacteria bacterium]
MARLRCTAVLISFAVCGLISAGAMSSQAADTVMLIDDFTNPKQGSRLDTRWRGFSDRVMGGVSNETVSYEEIDGRACLRLTGEVRLDNNGGFIQAALDLGTWGRSFDASGYTGLRLIVRGNGESYSVHLRTPDNRRPWQSYRAQFTAGADWQTIDLPFAEFQPYRLELPLDRSRLRRIGLVAIGREFSADLAVCEIAFY